MKTAEEILLNIIPEGRISVFKEKIILAMKVYAEQAIDECMHDADTEYGGVDRGSISDVRNKLQ